MTGSSGVKGVSIDAGEGHVTTLLGANGAGKTTILKAISGLLRTERGEVTKGGIAFDGERLDRLSRSMSSSAASSRCSRAGACSGI